MKTILIFAQAESFARALAELLDSSRYRLLAAHDYEGYTSPPFAILIECDLRDGDDLTQIESVIEAHPGCPVLVCAGLVNREIEERAYLAGVGHILSTPVRGPILRELIGRLERAAESPSEPRQLTLFQEGGGREAAGTGAAGEPAERGAIYREYAGIVTDGGSDERLLERFLALLHDRLGVSKAAILRRDEQSAPGMPQDLRAVSAVGLGSDHLLRRVLPAADGLAAAAAQSGRIIRRDSPPDWRDPALQRDFDALGINAAIPLIENSVLTGLLVVDGKITGEELDAAELIQLYHQLQGLGMAMQRNRREAARHNQLENIKRIPPALDCGHMIFRAPRTVCELSRKGCELLGVEGRAAESLTLDDLPGELAGCIYASTAGRHGAPLVYEAGGEPPRVLRIQALALDDKPPSAACYLVMFEDISESRRVRELEIKAAKLERQRSMAEMLSHEIGNAIAPLALHQQLARPLGAGDDGDGDESPLMSRSVIRIARLSRQMLYLARDELARSEQVPLVELLGEAYHDTSQLYENGAAAVEITGSRELAVIGDRQALRHAFSELMLNGLQAGGDPPGLRTVISAREGDNNSRTPRLEAVVTITDNGPGIDAATLPHISEPFFTTRSVGLGLGLTIAGGIVQAHGGSLEIRGSPQTDGVQAAVKLPAQRVAAAPLPQKAFAQAPE